jgi:transcriptional regulator with XRE-family HTH domain
MKELFREEIATRLRGLRAENKLTLAEVAEKARVSLDTVQRYEKNLVSMRVGVLAQILEVYNTNLAIFFEEIIAKTQNKKEG